MQLTRSVSDGKEVEVLGTPRQRCDGQLLHFVVAELPQRQQCAFPVTVLVSQVLVVAEIYITQHGLSANKRRFLYPQQDSGWLTETSCNHWCRTTNRTVASGVNLVWIFGDAGRIQEACLIPPKNEFFTLNGVFWCILSGTFCLCHCQKNVEFSAWRGDLVDIEDVLLGNSE